MVTIKNLLVVFLFISCTEVKNNTEQKTEKNATNQVSVVRSTVEINEKSVTTYTYTSANDTSALSCLIEVEGDRSAMEIRFANNEYYSSQIKMLQAIFQQAANDGFILDLESIFIGRLATTGDLAIAVTKKIQNGNINQGEVNDYQAMSSRMMDTPLVSDFNNLLVPLGISIKKVQLEKIFYANSEELVSSYLLATPVDSIPKQFLDCQVWLILK